jgi:uncharacterized membrane protein
MSANAVLTSRTAARERPPWELILLGLTGLSLVLLAVHIHRAFGLPAHPLVLHVPVVLVPVAGIAALALVARPAWMDRYGLALGVLAVASTAATILTVGAGKAFRADREQGGGFGGAGGEESHRLAEHAQSGQNLQIVVIAFTVALLVALLARRHRPSGAATAILRVVVAMLAVLAVFFVIRTGHLGAQLTWERGAGGPPGGGRSGPRAADAETDQA